MIEKVLHFLLSDIESFTPSRRTLRVIGIIAGVVVYAILSMKVFGALFGKTPGPFFFWLGHMWIAVWIASGFHRAFAEDDD
ncbi:MAG: hypothetical protein AB7U75_14730 [Hyphomicrobiaceae bacterium]